MRNLMLALVLVLVPFASAQEGTGITLNSGADIPTIHHTDGGSFNYTVDVGCLELVLTGGSPSVTVTGTIDNGTVQSDTQTLDPTVCASGGATSQQLTGSVTIMPGANASALQDQTVSLTATLTRANSEAITSDAEGTYQVSYRPGHTFTPDVAFPLGVTGGMAQFNVTVAITANAPTMFMYDFNQEGNGSLSGLIIKTVQEPTEFVMPITFTAPSGDWNQTSFEFDIWSHSLVGGSPGPDEMRGPVTFTFVNLDEGSSSSTSDGKDSPGIGAGLLLVGLVALGLLRRR